MEKSRYELGDYKNLNVANMPTGTAHLSHSGRNLLFLSNEGKSMDLVRVDNRNNFHQTPRHSGMGQQENDLRAITHYGRIKPYLLDEEDSAIERIVLDSYDLSYRLMNLAGEDAETSYRTALELQNSARELKTKIGKNVTSRLVAINKHLANEPDWLHYSVIDAVKAGRNATYYLAPLVAVDQNEDNTLVSIFMGDDQSLGYKTGQVQLYR